VSLRAGLLARVTASPFWTRRCFGVRLLPLSPGEHAFDVTSLALPRLLRRAIAPGARVLDLGTGSAAILGLWLWKRLGCRVTATEIDPAIAERARAHVRHNGAPIEVLEGRFFEPVRGAFDAVVFNPPYWRQARGERQGLPVHLRTQWDGGQDGTETLCGFLAAFARDGGAATAYVGLNRLHVPRARALARIAAEEQLELRSSWKHPWLPVDAYVLVRKKSPMARASSPVE
jgi:methylase of polypeptide subunit release factors